MGFITPAGRTSSVTFEGKKFHIQTEFKIRPSPKIVTSILLEGRLIHKVEKPWTEKLGEEGQAKVEQFLKKEHQKVARILKKTPYEFLPEEKDRYQTYIKKISNIKELENPFIFRYDGLLLYPHKEVNENLENISKILVQALRLGQSLADFSKVGEVISGVLEYAAYEIIWVYHNEKIWCGFLKKGFSADETIKKLGTLIQESNG